MKLNYPYKEYIFGLSVTLIVILYGSFIMYQITIIEGNNTFYFIFYLFVALFVVYWYVIQLQKYKNRFIIIEDDLIIIVNKETRNTISRSMIDCIIIAEHQQMLKIHHVIHIYLKDDNYFYITNEINAFKRLEGALKEFFHDKIYIPNKVVRGEFTKDLLLSHVQS